MNKNRKILIILIVFVLIFTGGFYIYTHSNKPGDKSTSKLNNKSNTKESNNQYNHKEDSNSQNSSSKKSYEEPKTLQKQNNYNDPKNSEEKVDRDKAAKLAAHKVNDKDSNMKFIFDHEEKKDNVDYYVIHAFDNMEDHSATGGWYYVNKSNGNVYEMDLSSKKLVLVK